MRGIWLWIENMTFFYYSFNAYLFILFIGNSQVYTYQNAKKFYYEIVSIENDCFIDLINLFTLNKFFYESKRSTLLGPMWHKLHFPRAEAPPSFVRFEGHRWPASSGDYHRNLKMKNLAEKNGALFFFVRKKMSRQNLISNAN